ncbi:hypothetical protein FSP39_016169 [Pinctada imbricata]|uniref:Uncharacterized protein n=1 Tax=Pinctada imbricata TaxID=66713 RepID=A0AA88YKH2_PINIB|nr:hypothetical protein FSP39_016169 [Pinctada imbricata]
MKDDEGRHRNKSLQCASSISYLAWLSTIKKNGNYCADFKTAVEGQPHKYIEMVNMAPMVRDCPPMTHFNQGTCDCSVLIIDTGHGTNIHGGVETSMHHSDPVDMGHDPMAADLANLPTSVLLEMLHQEQQISSPQFNVPTVPPPIPTQPVQSSWQEFTLPESGAKASLDQNQLVIRVPVDRPFDGTQFNQNVDQFSYVPTVEPIDPIVNMFGNAHAHQDFMIPTTTPVPRIEMYKPYVPETLANIPEVVAIITQIQQKVRSKTMAEQKEGIRNILQAFFGKFG